MIGALVVVYLYNFKVLPVERSLFEEEYVTNLISFLNIGLTGVDFDPENPDYRF